MTANVVSNLLKGKKYFCCLCFSLVKKDAFALKDEVCVDWKKNETKEISKILNHVLGGQLLNLNSEEFICNTCFKSARASYTFIKMCKDNSEQLKNIVSSLNNCLENAVEDLTQYKSLFVHIETKKFLSKKYYDRQRPVSNKTSALTRFRYVAYGSYLRHKKVTEQNEQKKRSHIFSEEMSRICKVIKESNCSKFECRACNKIFNKAFNLKKHYYSQHSAKFLQCKECEKSYGSEALLKQHMNDSHICAICSICGKQYNNRYSLLYHMRQHTGESPYECQYCGMKFKWSSRRAEHIRRYHMEPSVECDICRAMFKSLSNLYDHRKRHFNPNSRLNVKQVDLPE